MAAGLLLPAVVQAASLLVPEEYATIQAAVDVSAAGDTVLVGPGTWSDTETRTILFRGRSQPVKANLFARPGVTVIGREGPSVTFLLAQGEGLPKSIVHANDAGEPVRIEGLTITSDDTGALVGTRGGQVPGGQIEFKCCWFLNSIHRAVNIRDASIVLMQCDVVGNGSDAKGAMLATDATIEILHCSFTNNVGRAVEIRNDASIGSLRIIGSAFVGHGARAVGAVEVGLVEILDSRFVGNLGGAINVGLCSSGRIAECVFVGNSAIAGAGVWSVSSDVLIEKNTFYSCQVSGFGAAILIDGLNGGARSNIVAGCESTQGALVQFSGEMNPATGCNLLWNNKGGDFGELWERRPTDILADPLFCDPARGDLTVCDGSPAAAENSPTCGQIGALPVGCGIVSVTPTTFGRIKAAYRDGGQP